MLNVNSIIDANKMENALKEVGFVTERLVMSEQQIIAVLETGEGVAQPSDSMNWEVISEHERLLFPSPGKVIEYFQKQ